MLLTAHDVADAEIDVVGAGGEVVGGDAVASEEREVFDVGGRFGLLAEDEVFDGDAVAGVARDAETDYEGFAGGGAAVAFVAGDFALAGVEEPGAVWFGRVVGFKRREVAVGHAFGEDGLGYLFMEGEAVGLAVLLVPGEAQPLEAFEDGIEGLFGVALDVGVVDAEDHCAAVAAGVEPVKYEGAGAPDVQIARRRGRKTNSEHEIRV